MTSWNAENCFRAWIFHEREFTDPSLFWMRRKFNCTHSSFVLRNDTSIVLCLLKELFFLFQSCTNEVDYILFPDTIGFVGQGPSPISSPKSPSTFNPSDPIASSTLLVPPKSPKTPRAQFGHRIQHKFVKTFKPGKCNHCQDYMFNGKSFFNQTFFWSELRLNLIWLPN